MLEISFFIFMAETNFVNALIPFIGVRIHDKNSDNVLMRQRCKFGFRIYVPPAYAQKKQLLRIKTLYACRYTIILREKNHLSSY
jgi:hypothetical protein